VKSFARQALARVLAACYIRAMRKPGSLAELRQLRLLASNLFDQQMSPKDIANVLGVDDQSVRRWRRAYLKEGRQALALRRSSGRPVKLSDEQKRQLVEMLRHEPKVYGIDAYLWTTRLIARLILEKFGVTHHHDHVGVILHELGWSPQIPTRRAKERDERRISDWRDKTWMEIEKKVEPKAEPSSSPMKLDS
jgi:transposase